MAFPKVNTNITQPNPPKHLSIHIGKNEITLGCPLPPPLIPKYTQLLGEPPVPSATPAHGQFHMTEQTNSQNRSKESEPGKTEKIC